MVDTTSDKPIVLITGVTGYLGAHVADVFLKDGGFRVRGTVRSTKNPAKIEPLKKAFGDKFEELELVEADLLDEDSLVRACKDATYVVHTASPYVLNVRNHDDMIKPAVNGTLAVARGCRENKVKRLVVTSSVFAVFGINYRTRPDVFNDTHWSDPDCQNPAQGAYEKSKTLAEKALWKYQEDLPQDEKFEVVTVLPGAIFGPPLISAGGFTSGELID